MCRNDLSGCGDGTGCCDSLVGCGLRDIPEDGSGRGTCWGDGCGWGDGSGDGYEDARGAGSGWVGGAGSSNGSGYGYGTGARPW